MGITVIKEGDHLRILSSSEPIPENTPLELFTHGVDPWQAAQLDSAFRDDEDWGPRSMVSWRAKAPDARHPPRTKNKELLLSVL